MILPLPVRFDFNEWFILLSLLIVVLVFFALPKRFPWIVTLLIMLLNITLAKTSDYFIAAAFPLDLYDYNDTPKLDLFDEILQAILDPLICYLVVYWYDVWRANGFNRVLFVLLCSAVSVLYEWCSVQAHVFTYKGWHLYYSAMAYVVLISINIYFIELMKRWQVWETKGRVAD